MHGVGVADRQISLRATQHKKGKDAGVGDPGLGSVTDLLLSHTLWARHHVGPLGAKVFSVAPPPSSVIWPFFLSSLRD